MIFTSSAIHRLKQDFRDDDNLIVEREAPEFPEIQLETWGHPTSWGRLVRPA